MLNHEYYMRRALRLAALGRHASPNPMVGCIIISPDGAPLGQGWHVRPGEGHAEANALKCADPARVRGSVVYVTLEPCSFTGRTPPCADALIASGVSKVVVAVEDPDRRVSGISIARMRAAGIEVIVGICGDEARQLNAAYFKQRTTGVPWVTLKTAMTLDGKIAAYTGDSRWISSSISRIGVHRQLRNRCDAILTGVGTVIADDPELTTRLANSHGRNPWRIIVDSKCRTPLKSKIVKLAGGDGKTLIITSPAADNDKKSALQDSGCQIYECALSSEGRVDLRSALATVGTHVDMIGVLAEAGPELAASLLSLGLVDRWLLYIAPKIIGGRTSPGPIGGIGIERMSDAIALQSRVIRQSGPDIVIDARIG